MEFEDEVSLPSGEKWHFSKTTPVRNSANDVIGVQVVSHNITERKRAEEQIKIQSEILTNIAQGVYLIKVSDFTIIYTNPKFEEMFGYGPGELIGKEISVVNDLTKEKSPFQTPDAIMKVLKKTGAWHGEVKNIKKDGTTFWCFANVSVFDHTEHGKVLVSVHEDISDRKQ